MILLGGFILFKSDPGVVSIGGAVVALSGMSVYTSLNLQGSQENMQQILPSPKPKSIPDDSTDFNVNTNGSTIV